MLHGEDSISEDSIVQENKEEEVVVGNKGNKEEESMEVSIQVLSRCINNNSMKVLGRIGDSFIEILVDSGSTHNFLDPLIIKVAKLRVEKVASLQVKIANGDTMLSQGQCEETLKIQGSKFRIHFHALSLGAVI